MTTIKTFLFTGHLRRIALWGGLTVAASMSTGCLSIKHYADPALPMVTLSQLKPPAVKQPVQLLFEYQNNLASNAKATEMVRPVVMQNMTKSGLFSDVVVAPAAAERKLFITINNFFVTKDAASKGFMTGLTLGAAGSMVTDGFKMDASYTVPGKPEVKHSYSHAMHSTIGNADGPPGLAPLDKDKPMDAIVGGLIMNLLKDLSNSGEL